MDRNLFTQMAADKVRTNLSAADALLAADTADFDAALERLDAAISDLRRAIVAQRLLLAPIARPEPVRERDDFGWPSFDDTASPAGAGGEVLRFARAH